MALVALVGVALLVAAVAVSSPAVAQPDPPADDDPVVGLVSVDRDGARGAGGVSRLPVVSDDGRVVAFSSNAPDLTDPPTPGPSGQVFARDLTTGQTTLVSIDTTGDGPGDSNAEVAAVSADGRIVVFTSTSSDLAEPATHGTTSNVFAHDLVTGETTLVSVNAAGTAGGDDHSGDAALSGDGRTVMFRSEATDLTDPPTPGATSNVFARDLTTGRTTLISANAAGTGGGDRRSDRAMLSSDGQVVVFTSEASDLTDPPIPAPPSGGIANVYAHDRATGDTALLSASSTGDGGGDNHSTAQSMSADATTIAFTSYASDLTDPPTPGDTQHVFVHDRTTGQTTAVADHATELAVVSADASTVVFASSAVDVVDPPVPQPPSGRITNLYAHDVATGQVEVLSTTTGDTGDDLSYAARVSADGRVVVFAVHTSDGTDPSVPSDGRQVFAHDRATGRTTLLTPAVTGDGAANDHAELGGISRDGRVVTFHSGADDLVPTATEEGADVFVALRPGPDGVEVGRVDGPNRFATAAAVALDGFDPAQTDTVYVAAGDDFPDALAGGPLAAARSAPILLVHRTDLPQETAEALAALSPSEVVALGGTGPVPQSVLDAAGTAAGGATTGRIAGADRYETAAAIAGEGDQGDAVYLAVGTDFPDALAGGPATSGAPIVLSAPDGLPEATGAALATRAPDRVVAIGGEAAISQAVLDHAGAITGADTDRLSGANRFLTALALAQQRPDPEVVYLAVGTDFPDALAAAPVAAGDDAPILLTHPDVVPPEVVEWLGGLASLDRVVVLGGTGAIRSAIELQLHAALLDSHTTAP